MCLLKVLFKFNSVPCRESWYKNIYISGKPLECIIYTKRKRKRKNLLLRALLSLSLDVDENDI